MDAEGTDTLCEAVKGRNGKMSALQQEVISLQNRVLTTPKTEDIVLWSGLREAMFTPATPSEQLENSELRRVSEELTAADLSQATQYLEDFGHVQVLEAAHHPELLETAILATEQAVTPEDRKAAVR
ncbi:hypothetical protein MM560_G197n24 [Manis javanica]|nr:hypothetical protein MM560_G197n24 [Manis javanica]